MMKAIVRRLPEMTETETWWDGTICETRFFNLAPSRFNWLMEYGALAAVQPFDFTRHIISVSAFVDPNTGWGGWSWMNDEFASAGIEV